MTRPVNVFEAIFNKMEAVKGILNNAFSDQMRAIWNTWLLIQVLLFCFTICAIAAASDTGACTHGREALSPSFSPLTLYNETAFSLHHPRLCDVWLLLYMDGAVLLCLQCGWHYGSA